MKNKLKILVFIENFAFPTYTFIYNEIIYLSQKNDVLVLTTNRINESIFPFEKVLVIPFYGGFLDYKIRKTLRSHDLLISSRKKTFSNQITAVVNEYQPDVIHCHFGYESWLFINNFKTKDLIPIFLHFHGFDASHKLRSELYRNTLKYFLKREEIFPIFVSKNMHNTVQSAIATEINKWHLLYYGTDCLFFSRNHRSPCRDIITFLQISSFAEKKGHIFTIEAFKILIEKKNMTHCRLILAGEGIEKKKLVSLVNSYSLDNFISFPGLVNISQAKELMENANYFVHHSVTSKIGDTEGIPNALMEAMAMELPVISTYHSGIPELVEDGVNGLLVKERDIEAYANAMEKILSWGYLPENRKKIEKYFEKEKHGALLESYYKEAIEQMKKKQE